MTGRHPGPNLTSMRLELAKQAGSEFAAAANADAVLVAARTRDPLDMLLLFDFRGIEAASSSFLRRTLGAALRGEADVGGSEALVAVTGLTNETREGISDVLTPLKLSTYEVLSFRKGAPERVRLLGAPLEAALNETLKLLIAAGRPMSAPAMRESDPQRRTITPTAWNNRLNDLAHRRLIRRRQSGRRWTYEAFVTEVVDG